MKQCYWILNPIEVKSVYHFLFEANVKLVSRNMKLHNVSHEGTLSQYMSNIFLMTIDMSSSCHQVTLPSQLSGRYCIKKKKKWRRFIFFIWSISQNSVHSTYATILFQVGKFAKIVLRVLVFLSSRDRAPFFSWFCLGYLSPLNVSW